jgi:hypothetical protein
MNCHVCTLAKHLPSPRVDTDGPVVQFLREYSGVSEAPGVTLAQFFLPVARSAMVDLTASANVLEWWPDLPQRFLDAVATFRRDGFKEPISDPYPSGVPGDGKPRCVVISVIVPIPSSVMADPDMDLGRSIIPAMAEAAAYQIRTYQLAVRAA